MSASVADDMIRSYFERWQRLEEEKSAISDDLKELFAEAKGNGLEAKALRTVFREQVGDKNALQEFDAICDLYRASLNAPRAGRARESRSYAEAKGRDAGSSSGRTAEFDSANAGSNPAPVTSDELTDTQEQPEEPATQSGMGGEVRVEGLGSFPSDAGNPDHLGHAPLESASDEISSVISNPQPAASLGNADEAEADSSPASAVLSDADVPQFLKPEQRKSIADYRPNCLNPDACGATGLQHCYTCRKAMEAASETEAA